jgi:hypothetical protein
MSKFKTAASAIVLGSMSAVIMSSISGCSSAQEQEAKNRFLIIEQDKFGKYSVVEEVPTDGPNRAIIRERDANGRVTERLMDEAEMKKLAESEYQKVQNGTSETTQQNSGGGMGLGGTILAVAAGSLMGNMIANQLMGNKNFSRNSNSANKSAYHSNKKSGMSGNKKKSFFGNNKKTSSSGKSSSWGGKSSSSGWGG